MFTEINEAYEILSDAYKRKTYDLQRNNPWADVKEPTSPSYTPQPFVPGTTQSNMSSVQKIIQRLYPYSRWINRAGLLLTILLLADYFLPPLLSVEHVQDVYAESAAGHSGQYFSCDIIETDVRRILVQAADQNTRLYTGKTYIQVYYTPIFSVVKLVTQDDGAHPLIIHNIYGPVFLVPLMTLFLALLAELFPRRKTLVVNAGAANAILILATFYLMVSL